MLVSSRKNEVLGFVSRRFTSSASCCGGEARLEERAKTLTLVRSR
jgi:hypothetical protein